MRRITGCVVLASLFGLILLAGCDEDITGSDDDEFFAEEPFSYEIPLGAKIMLQVAGINGEISITGDAEATSFTVTGKRRVEADSQADADAHLADVQVLADTVGAILSFRTDQPEDPEGRVYIVDYEVSMPKNIEVVITNTNGSTTLSAVEADATIANLNGQIIANAVVGNTNFSVSSGSINASVEHPPGGLTNMGIANGTISLTIPQETNAEFSATVVNGSISINQLTLSNESSTLTSVTGTLGTGDGTVTLGAVNGTIEVFGS